MTHLPDDSSRERNDGASGTPDIPSEVIVRYLAGECTATESAAVEAWRSAGNAHDRVILDLPVLLGAYARRTSLAPSASGITHRVDAILQDRTLPGGPSHESVRKPGTRIPSVAVRSWLPRRAMALSLAAASVAVILVLAWGRTEITKVSTPVARQVSSYTTENGERAQITLPDGSRVMLNVGSHLEVPANYGAGNRTVQLTGEALFTVTHHTRTPFTVVAGPSTTRVLGTRFSVRRYETDTAAVIAVGDGKVAVHSTVLVANQEIIVSNHSQSAVRQAAAGRFRFAEGVLLVSGVSLREAIPDLNRWFNTDVRLGDPSVGALRLMGEYTPGSVGSLAEILELTFDVRVIRNGRILTIYPRG